MPRSESRGWLERHQGNVELARQGDIRVAFFGDSITAWANGQGWKRDIEPLGIGNFGIAGDGVQNLTWRLQNGELEGMKPRVVVMMIGTNNLWKTASQPRDIAAGVALSLREIRAKQPQAKILLLGVPPLGKSSDDPLRPKVRALNALLEAFVGEKKADVFLDWGPRLLDADGTLSQRRAPDGIHPSAQGYEVWVAALSPVLKRLLGVK